jgi:hypothetical protein
VHFFFGKPRTSGLRYFSNRVGALRNGGGFLPAHSSSSELSPAPVETVFFDFAMAPRIQSVQFGSLIFHSKFAERGVRLGRVLAMVNIYVGNLAWACSSDDLLKLFSSHGQVARAQVVMDRETGRSRGFGFVEMPNPDEAQAAIQALNGIDMSGRPLTVNEAKPREPRPAGGGGRGFGGGGGFRGPRY